jgi:hypothetical protein
MLHLKQAWTGSISPGLVNEAGVICYLRMSTGVSNLTQKTSMRSFSIRFVTKKRGSPRRTSVKSLSGMGSPGSVSSPSLSGVGNRRLGTESDCFVIRVARPYSPARVKTSARTLAEMKNPNSSWSLSRRGFNLGTSPRCLARSNVPNTPRGDKPRSIATLRPANSSIRIASACTSSASAIASDSPGPSFAESSLTTLASYGACTRMNGTPRTVNGERRDRGCSSSEMTAGGASTSPNRSRSTSRWPRCDRARIGDVSLTTIDKATS